MKHFALLVTLVVLLVSVTGCKPKDKIVGKWSGQQGPNTITMDFKADQTLVMEIPVPQNNIKIFVDCSWSRKDDDVTITPKGFRYEGNVPDGIKKVIEAGSGKPQTSKVTFEGDDVMSVANAGGAPAKMTRIK